MSATADCSITFDSVIECDQKKKGKISTYTTYNTVMLFLILRSFLCFCRASKWSI